MKKKKIKKCKIINENNDENDDNFDDDKNNKIKISPFWNNNVKMMTKKLFIPNNNNSYTIENQGTLSGSWFNVTTLKSKNKRNIMNCLEKETEMKFRNINGKLGTVKKCQKVKIFLNKDQRKYIKIMIGTYRYYYNRCVSYFNNYNKGNRSSHFFINPNDKTTKIELKGIKSPYDFQSIRKLISYNYPTWLFADFPKHLIDKAIKECANNYNACLKAYKKNKKPFEFKFKTRKDKFQTIDLEKCMITDRNSLFHNFKGDEERPIFRDLKTSERFNKYNYGDSSLTYNTCTKEAYINLSYKSNKSIPKKYDVCSIDPGVRTFLTVYDENKITEIGKDNGKLKKICKEIDMIHSRVDSKEYVGNNGNKYIVNAKRRQNLKKALHRKIEYLKNLKRDLHKKSAKYLCDNYSSIILPPFEIQQMASNLNSRIARQMYNLSHYSFREYLINKAKENNINVHIKGEEYTSMTCGRCGALKIDLGEKKEYLCNNCGLIIDRDINGARNVMLKNIEKVYNERKLRSLFSDRERNVVSIEIY